MKTWLHALALGALALAAAVAAAGERKRDARLDAAFDALMARYALPGLAIGVIDDGRVVYVRTAGELEAGSGKPVTPRTLFKIASNTKAMTTSVLARLVEAGKLKWDDRVTRYLPSFRMADPWVTREMQVRDLLVHHSGLPEGAGDLMLWPEPNRFTRDDILAGLAYLKPAYSFRAGYAYDNLLYVVAGEVAAAAGGASYEALVRREIFEPLGLARCRVGEFDRDAVGDVAQPHARKAGRNVVTGADPAHVPAITSAAAGGIRCSLEDMLAWAENWLAPTSAQLTWLTEAQRRIVWTPRTPMPISRRRYEWDRSRVYAYGYGWRLADVDGVWTVSHTGTLSGMYSVMMLLPDRRAGFVMLTNGEGDDARTVMTEVLLKHFTKPDDARGVAYYADALDREAKAESPAIKASDAPRSAATADELGGRLGVWRDPWFGELSICARDGAVRVASAKSPLMVGRVMRAERRFVVAWDGDAVDVDAWLDFGADGRSLTLAKVDPKADFSTDFEDLAFARERDCD